MRLLLIGSGGREHALAWKFKQEDPSLELIAAPGNPGIAQLGECVSISATDIEGLESLARDRAVDLTVVGPEASLALGVVDRFQAAGLPIFGPTKAAAEIETSKAFSKQLMLEEGIPTARAEMHTDVREAKEAIRRFGAPVVVKASGLAAGKGVIVCSSIKEADRAVEDMLQGNRFGAAGAEVLIEEFMEGEEISIFAISDGHSFTVLPGLQDHKRLLNGDLGANTGGMGAYFPVTLKDPTDPMATPGSDSGGYSVSLTMSATLGVFAPTIRGLAARGRPFKGLLYAGLMITADGPKVVEFNCRFGDPETQALMPVLGMRLLDLMVPISRGERIFGYPADGVFGDVSLRTLFSYNVGPACVTTVLAAQNYPESPRTGDIITLAPPEENVFVFHAGTARNADGLLVTAGGRVLAVSAVAPTIAEAQRKSLDHARRITFAGKQFRSDIGWREIARQTRA